MADCILLQGMVRLFFENFFMVTYDMHTEKYTKQIYILMNYKVIAHVIAAQGRTRTLPAPQKLAECSFPTHPRLFSQDSSCSDLVGKHFGVYVLIISPIKTIVWRLADFLSLRPPSASQETSHGKLRGRRLWAWARLGVNPCFAVS